MHVIKNAKFSYTLIKIFIILFRIKYHLAALLSKGKILLCIMCKLVKMFDHTFCVI